MNKPIPKHLQKVINEIFRVEGDYNPVDRDNLPCLKGITAAVWADWVNNDPNLKLKDQKLTPKMAADDLRAIAGEGGKPYTNLSNEAFTKQASQITYETFFTKLGFDKINSQAIQQYVMEISFHRGPASAQWALNYATGVEHRHADPLLPKGLKKSPERKDAVAHANGFLSTGKDDTNGTQGAAVNPEAEERLYGRLRTAKLIQESHFIGRDNPRMTKMALGLFKRAFEFEWSVGNADDPGLVAGKDDAHLKIYNQFKSAYDDYTDQPTRTARVDFTRVATVAAKTLLADPSSPLNSKSPEKPIPPPKPSAPEPTVIAAAPAKPATEVKTLAVAAPEPTVIAAAPAKPAPPKPLVEAKALPAPKEQPYKAPAAENTKAFDKFVNELQQIQKQIPRDENGLERIIDLDTFNNAGAAIPPPQPVTKPAPPTQDTERFEKLIRDHTQRLSAQQKSAAPSTKPSGNPKAPSKDELGFEMLIRGNATRLPVQQELSPPTSAPTTPPRRSETSKPLPHTAR